MGFDDIILVKNRSDIGAGTRGSDMGIDAMEIAAINAGSDFFNKVHFIDVPTHNDSVYLKNHFPFAKRIQYVLQQCERVAGEVSSVLNLKKFPIVLSGDHSSALGTISGIKKAFPAKQLGVIWIDAHADIHSPYTSPSGNIHGMPLAAALSKDHLAIKVHDIANDVSLYWNQMKNIGSVGPKLLPEHLVYFGLRDFEKEEKTIIDRHSIKYFTVDTVRDKGIVSCCDEVNQYLKDCDIIYISFDVDSMDSLIVSEGTGTPVPKGFTPDEVLSLIKCQYDTGKVICTEFCEINPLLDRQGNKMAETAFSILEEVAPLSEYHL